MSTMTTLPSGVQYAVMTPGSGPGVRPGQRVSVHYHGWLENGTVFDSSNEPFEFLLGGGQVIPGWEFGVAGMQVGEIRRLWIPAELAYGEEEDEDIPANSNLFFDVELVAIPAPPTTSITSLDTLS